jgi:hypothetical protein
MYKPPALREDLEFLRDCKEVYDHAQTLGTTVVKKASQALWEQCQSLRLVALEQLESIQTARYQYRPLDRSRQEIRLLTLEPGSGTSTLRCTLEHAFLDANPPPYYETISYVCGDPSKKRTILLNGHGVRAMATSESALRRMRLQDKPRTLWVDSICIDQDNIDERGHQVGMMYQIYSLTFRNLVWLGPYDDTMSEAVTAMDAILQEIAAETRDYADFNELLVDHNNTERYSEIPLSSTVDFLAFLRLLDNPWFSRLWIVQEASLAPSSMCHYGELELPLMSILRSARWLVHKWYQLPETPPSTLQHLYYAASISDSADKTYGRFHTRVVFSVMLNLLHQFGHMRTFDRRDRVFSILGLWQMFTETAMLPGVLQPDYNLSVGEVFESTIRYTIVESGRLAPLEKISAPPIEGRDASWPSWLPAIDRGALVDNEPYHLRAGVFGVDNKVPVILKKDSQRPNDLIVSGVLLGSIVRVTPAVALGMHVSQFQALVACLEHLGCDETRISLVLPGGVSRGTRIAHHEALRGYQSFKAYLEEYGSFPCLPRDLPSSASGEDKSASRYWQATNEIALRRAVFYTATGYM